MSKKEKKKVNKSILSIDLYKRKSILFHYNFLPFLLIFGYLLFAYYTEEINNISTVVDNTVTTAKTDNSIDVNDDSASSSDEKSKDGSEIIELNVHMFLLGLTLCLYVVSNLFNLWSVDYKCFNSLQKVKNIKDAQFVKVTPSSHIGSKEICEIRYRPALTNNERDQEEYSIEFQKRKLVYNQDRKTFEKVKFAIPTNVHQLITLTGYQSPEEIEYIKMKYGQNQFDVPIPAFLTLYKEQAIAPFFVFQVFCVLLWCLEDYIIYCLFTLFLLLIFEATIVKSRLKNLQTLREMSSKPSFLIYVYRQYSWKQINSTELLPGDIVSIGRSQNEASNIVPCDLLLLSGGCVVNEAMLTGESTPHHKEAIEDKKSNPHQEIDLKNDKNHILYSGTQIVQHETSNEKLANISKAPDRGCIAYVLSTGFNTNQGRLMRTIWFSSERVTANNKESFLFIMFLLAFGIAASVYIYIHGKIDPRQTQYKLLLRCIMVITSVVPPELPMELSMAVNSSLISLIKLGIYCTEPFRIPFAGKVDICCFDKTGTLTTDDLILQGVAYCPKKFILDINDISSSSNTTNTTSSNSSSSSTNPSTSTVNDENLIAPQYLSDQIQFILAGCHSLVIMDSKLVGDPMESAAIKAIPWICKGDKTTHQKKPWTIEIAHRYHFSSQLKRMSTVCKLINTNSQSSTFWSFTKGAPEVMKPFFSDDSIPADYDQLYRKYSKQGSRVIALGFKKLDSNLNPSQLKAFSREDIESSLTFSGFLVFDCPLKPDSKTLIDMLTFSSHMIVMITGDNSLTACHVAKQLGFMKQPKGTLILEKQRGWVPIEDDNGQIELDTTNAESLLRLSKEYDLCVSGETLELISESAVLSKYLYLIKVFARVSPDQKQIILSNMKTNGFNTLMAGDGTNDVGALKQAHVGVAILNRGEYRPYQEAPSFRQLLKQQQQQLQQQQQQLRMKKLQASRQNLNPNAIPPLNTGTTTTTPNTTNSPSEMLQQQMNQLQADMEPQMVKLGDASIAAPFTSKSSSLIPVTHIIRQGRCTLVTTFQMYKILALNSLIMAYSSSALYIDAIKLGDTQATLGGLLVACCFLFISNGKPLSGLANRKPSSNLFSPYMFSSILLQFFLHLACLIYIKDLATTRQQAQEFDDDLDSPFKATLVNSAVFLIRIAMQIATFAVNYKGHPFMQSLRENKPLLYVLSSIWGLCILLSMEAIPYLNETFELVPFPDTQFQLHLIGTIVFDLVGAWIIEKICSKILPS
ncbi:putative cation-transporting ATPase [Tieghemostelium lacteum]|uniref:Putative cation-transporting ATPase n=1 Tax=Tieghemostelium lacteum TaxID=361077 RepID=A0A151ZFV1_TIELA|nr:putative cation-transporting ATPase [Tieghemostelium lacteum]|eukprot:KYQ92744.1 putative cation-transporting ATPase [Tieghemostelium lacteum]